MAIRESIKGRFFWFVCLWLGLLSGLSAGEKYGLILGPIVALTFALAGGLMAGLMGGFTHRLKVEKASFPNQGIKLSARNSLAVFLVALPICGLCGGLTGWLMHGLTQGLFAGLLTGLTGGLHFGGSTVIKHCALRLILWLNGDTPFNFVNFLDHCAKLILLKKVGGGYIFIHRMLLEYFAELAPSPSMKEDRKT